MIAVFFSDISWFTVDSFIWGLSSEVWLSFAQYSLGDQAPTFHNASWGSLDPQEIPFVRYYLSLSSTYWITHLSKCSTILGLPYILWHGPRLNTPTRLIYPHMRIIIFFHDKHYLLKETNSSNAHKMFLLEILGSTNWVAKLLT